MLYLLAEASKTEVAGGVGAVVATFLVTKFWPELAEYFKRKEKREEEREKAERERALTEPEKVLERQKSIEQMALDRAREIATDENAKRLAWQGEIRESYSLVIQQIKAERADDIARLEAIHDRALAENRTLWERERGELRADVQYWREQTTELKSEVLAAISDHSGSLSSLKTAIEDLIATYTANQKIANGMLALVHKDLTHGGTDGDHQGT